MRPIFLVSPKPLVMPSKRINLWSSPRNISTALMYSFAQRVDTSVVDEPLYAHYLDKTKSEAQHPGLDLILKSQSTDGNQVVKEVIFGTYPTPMVVFKQMTHHLIKLDLAFLSETKNVLLIRDPRAIIASYSKVVPNPAIYDIGVVQQLDLYQELKTRGTLSAIVDAKELLLNPEKVLRQLCQKLEIPWHSSMLQWAAGPRQEDGVWAPYWYHKVHQSTGFKPFEDRNIKLNPYLEELAGQCNPYYQSLYKEAIKA